jgi:GT2 family glycosyltransferase
MNDAAEPPRGSSLRRRRAGVTANIAGGEPAPQPAAASPVRLGFAVLDRFDRTGVLGLGWLCDPEDRIRRLTVAGTGTDLLEHAVALDDPRSLAVLGVPSRVRAKLAFPVLIPADEIDWDRGLRLAAEPAAGAARSWVAKPTGSANRLIEIFEELPIEDGLRLGARIIALWQRHERRAKALPILIDDLLGRLHRRIDKDRNYGLGSPGWQARAAVDGVLRAGAAGLLVTGWCMAGADDRIREIAAVSLFGRHVALPLPLPRLARPDQGVEDCGFAVFVPVAGMSPDERFWFLEIGFDSGQVRRLPFVGESPPTPRLGIETAFDFLKPVERNAMRLPELFRDVLSPAVDALWAEARRDTPAAAPVAYGEPPGAAQISVIVPLYRRIDFVRHQIARFSNDPEFRSDRAGIELVYVLDDPALREPFQLLCRDVHDVYGVPFRALALERNLGYSGASNAGAAIASAPLLLFLNSDVLPKRARWAGRLASAYRRLERCGILGCRLLLEDGAIEHAGMTFRRSTLLPGSWQNEHPAKGLPTAFDRAPGATRVPAVTGACLMIDRDLFAKLGGLGEEYVIGDFEDSDLCLKAYEAGHLTYYTPEVELYHLERQSVKLLGQADWRQTLTLYNMWKHTQKWGALIPSVLAGVGRP